MPTTVRDVMTTDPITCETTDSAVDAAQRMREHDIGDVLVVDGGELRGIVTDRDITVRVVADGKDPNSVTLGDVCSSDLETVTPGEDLGDVIRDMRDRAIRRVPVVENGTAVGILSLGDLAVMKDADSLLADISAAPSNT
jgi:CBS domain-containing protein